MRRQQAGTPVRDAHLPDAYDVCAALPRTAGRAQRVGKTRGGRGSVIITAPVRARAGERSIMADASYTSFANGANDLDFLPKPDGSAARSAGGLGIKPRVYKADPRETQR